jgi:NAD(P)-dependent dehydrogenase (short-subunit alcohol dehydrogenase family)
VVTGAARGIGEAIAKWLIMARADVTVVDKDEETLKRAFRTERCQTLFGDLSDEEDVARVAIFLLSDAWSGYITGQNIPVDGGLSLHSWAA